MGRGLRILNRLTHMESLPQADILIIDEFDETIIEHPYAF